jgi:hypothetical protein
MRPWLVLLAAFVDACDSPICPQASGSERDPAPTGSKWGFFDYEGNELVLATGGDASINCSVLEEVTRLGTRTCHVVEFEPTKDPLAKAAWGERKLAELSTEHGRRLVTEAHFITINEPLSRVEQLSIEIDGLDFRMAQVFASGDSWIVIWSTGDSLGATTDVPQRVAGVGRLVGSTIEMIGPPFFTGPAGRLRDGIAAGRDPTTGHVWLDSPDGVNVIELDETGAILRSVDHGAPIDPTAQRTVRDWQLLPDGRWLGRDASALCTFDALDRRDQRCFEPSLSPEPAEPYHTLLDAEALPSGDVLTAWRLTAFEPTTSSTENAPGRIFLGLWNGDVVIDGRANDDQLEQCHTTDGISNF